ncbi:MAG: pentapeptide repeat-containing protein [Cyanobacteria bacterium P01_F01_bin.143]
MKYFLRLGATLLLCVTLLFPLPAIAGSSTAVTPSSFSDLNPDDLKNKNFSGKVLQRLDFAKVDLSGANFSNSDLRGTVFNASDLSNANLQGADFTYGFAYLTDFQGADLSDAIFRETILSFSSFEDTIIDGTDFTLAILEKWQVNQLCENATGVNSQNGVDTRRSLGCDY